MRPGWKTSEFWVALVSQLLALAVLLGVIPVQDRATLEGALATAVTAAFVLVASAAVAWKYMGGRVDLKTLAAERQGDHPAASARHMAVGGAFLPAVLLGLVAAGVASAQGPPAGFVKACLLPWRARVEWRLEQLRRQPPPAATDPALLAALQRLADLQAQTLPLLQRQQVPAPPAPLPSGPPQQEVHHYYWQPRVELPAPGAPRIDLPAPGIPKIDMPTPQQPRIDIQAPGAPRIQIQAPGAPRIDLRPPGEPAPAVPTPSLRDIPAPTMPRAEPPAPPTPAAPTGYQRYTRQTVVRALARPVE
jgi:hypothetical protein